MKNPKTLAIIAAMLAIVFWASAYVGIRVGVESFSAGALGLFRYGTAAIIMAVLYIALPKRTKISWKDGLLIALTGAIGIGLYNIAINKGEETVIAAVAGFVIATLPVLNAVLARWVFNERLRPLGYLGIAISLGGIVMIGISESEGHLAVGIGILYLVISVFCGSLYGLSTKYLIKKFGAVELTALCIMAAGIVQLVFLPELIHEIPQASDRSIIAAIYLGVFPAAFAYLSFCYALKFFPVVGLSSTLYVMPFITTLLGWVILGELPTSWGFVGGIVALIGPVLVTRYGVKNID